MITGAPAGMSNRSSAKDATIRCREVGASTRRYRLTSGFVRPPAKYKRDIVFFMRLIAILTYSFNDGADRIERSSWNKTNAESIDGTDRG